MRGVLLTRIDGVAMLEHSFGWLRRFNRVRGAYSATYEPLDNVLAGGNLMTERAAIEVDIILIDANRPKVDSPGSLDSDLFWHSITLVMLAVGSVE